MSDTGWYQLTAKLSSVVFGLVPRDTLILHKERRRYVQLAHVGSAVHAETVSNKFLPADQRLSAEQERRLTELGWLLPEPPGNLNYYHEISVPVSVAEAQRLARLLVQTLREIHGVDSPAELVTEGWNDQTGQPLSFTIPA